MSPFCFVSSIDFEEYLSFVILPYTLSLNDLLCRNGTKSQTIIKPNKVGKDHIFVGLISPVKLLPERIFSFYLHSKGEAILTSSVKAAGASSYSGCQRSTLSSLVDGT